VERERILDLPTLNDTPHPLSRIPREINKMIYDLPNLIHVNGFWVPPFLYNIKVALWSIRDER